VSRPNRVATATLVAAILALGLVVSVPAEVVQQGHVRVSFTGRMMPNALPRSGSAPIAVSVGAKITAVGGAEPPQLRQMAIAINASGRLDPAGLPRCRVAQIQPATTQGALEACRRSLVGRGSFSARVLLPEQTPFPSAGEVYAFNGSFRGHPAILVHVYGAQPAPTSYTLPFQITTTKGTFGTMLSASLPDATSKWGYVTGLSLTLGRTFSVDGKRRSYLTASCPAPGGFSRAAFPLARAGFGFAGGAELGSTIVRSCSVQGRSRRS
jgi:hypothetical protein